MKLKDTRDVLRERSYTRASIADVLCLEFVSASTPELGYIRFAIFARAPETLHVPVKISHTSHQHSRLPVAVMYPRNARTGALGAHNYDKVHMVEAI